MIVAASLIAYANESHSENLPELIKNTKCILCCPDGETFKRPQDMFDPKSQVLKLFSPNDSMCPHDCFLKQNGLLYQSLLDLGMMTSLPWNLVVDRAKHMQSVFESDRTESFKYLVILLESVKENLYRGSPANIEIMLRTIPFLPVMKRPKDYPLTWKGNPSTLLCGPKLTKPTSKYDTFAVNPVYACGSQISILGADAVPFTLPTDKVTRFLGITKDLRESDVVSNFSMLIQKFNKGSHIQSYLPMVNCTVKEVYKYWVSKVDQGHTLKETVSCIKGTTCIWNDTVNKFLHPSCVAFSCKMEGPFLFKVPAMFPSSLKSLMKDLGVKHDFPVEVMLNALSEMKSEYKNKVLPNDCQSIIQLILLKLSHSPSVVSKRKVFLLLDENFILRDIENLKYNDAPWCSPEEKFIYCHSSIERGLALRLGVTPVKNVMLEALDITDQWFEDFGQEEKLTIRLGNILRDYPRDITFLKEMLQNADDAGATKLYVIWTSIIITKKRLRLKNGNSCKD